MPPRVQSILPRSELHDAANANNRILSAIVCHELVPAPLCFNLL